MKFSEKTLTNLSQFSELSQEEMTSIEGGNVWYDLGYAAGHAAHVVTTAVHDYFVALGASSSSFPPPMGH